MRWTAYLIIGCIAACSLSAHAQEDDPSLAERIQRWVDELDGERFQMREDAMTHLIEAGRPSIDPLQNSLPERGLEAATRGVYVLRELAMSDDAETEDAARMALQTLAQSGESSATRRAADTLASLNEIRQARAIEKLRELGAEFEDGSAQIGLPGLAPSYKVSIGEDFKGTVDDLRHLRWITDVKELLLEGEQVTNEWMAKLASMKQPLNALTLKRCKISDEGMAHLKDLQELQLLTVYYIPLTDRSVEHLKTLTVATLIKLYGTKISYEGAEKLQKALGREDVVDVDYRRGAFLGVSCREHPSGCLISLVQPGTSASKADLRVGDVIIKYNGKKVEQFDALTELIGENVAGDTVTIEVLRDDRSLEKEVTLGEWP